MKGSLRKFNSSYIEENASKLAKDQILGSFRILFKGEDLHEIRHSKLSVLIYN